MSMDYGFVDNRMPLQPKKIASIDFTNITGDVELLGRIFALKDEVAAKSRQQLTEKIESAEQQWESARVAGLNARNDFNSHKRSELTYQNDVASAQAKMTAAHRLATAWRDSPMDVYASKSEREAHTVTLADYQHKAEQAEKECLQATSMQETYYIEAQRLADEYKSKQAAFANIDSELNRLKKALAELED